MGPFTTFRPLQGRHLLLTEGLDGASMLCKANLRTHLQQKHRTQRVMLTAVVSRGAICNRASEHHSAYHTGNGHSRRQQLRCSAAAGTVDRTLMVKMSLAQTSNQLDLSECGLTSVPDDVLALTNLEVSSHAILTHVDMHCTSSDFRTPFMIWIT